MRIPRPTSMTDWEDNILPMINIVFLLLIFFMIAGALSASDPFEITPLETRAGAETAQNNTVLYAGRDGLLSLHGERVTLADLPQAFQALQAEQGLLQIKADRDVDATLIVDIMALAQDAGLEKLVLLTKSGVSAR